jgi:tRNA A37 methylthiotransferase MiaB|nr:radical SAM protein [Oxalobacteraceae bacterium]
MTYRIAFVQPNFQQGPKELNAYYLPYSAGVIWAYARQDPWIRENFELTGWVWRRDALEPVVQQLAKNDVVAFSTYVWNHNYNYELARRIKQINPQILTIFGGPEPAITDPDLFRKNPFMDLVICYEGEITMRNVLRAYETRDWHNIPGVLFNVDGEAVKTTDAKRIDTLGEVPSPYLEGIFDQLIEDNPGIMWQGTLETSRGCPFMCTFCDWGSLTYNKVKKFELDRVFEELEWMAQRDFDWISITDANFGMFVERDSMIADKIIECQEKYGSPRSFSVAWAKNQKREVLDIVKKLLDSRGFNQGLTLSVQSLDLSVLENIKRRNMEINKLEEVFELCEQRNIPAYTELILGLPGETVDTWKNNFYALFKMGNHTGITVFQAQLLENAEMNLTQKKQFEITSQPVSDYFAGSYSNEHVVEYIDVITGTRDMPFDRMLEAQMFSWFINTFHINGLSTLLSRFVYRYQGVEYSDFYEELYQFIQNDAWWQKEQAEVFHYFHSWMRNGKINHPNIGIEIHGWNIIHRTVLNLHAEKQYEAIFNMLSRFMQRYDLPQDMFDSLMRFQRRYLVAHDDMNSYPEQITLDYNIWEYLTFGHDLEKRSSSYLLDFPEDKTMSLSRFLELIYFARRRNFGKTTVERVTNEADQTDVARRGAASARAAKTNVPGAVAP